MKFKVKDLQLVKQGKNKIALAEQEMPVLAIIKRDFEKKQPFKDVNIACCLHVTKETAVLMRALNPVGPTCLWQALTLFPPKTMQPRL